MPSTRFSSDAPSRAATVTVDSAAAVRPAPISSDDPPRSTTVRRAFRGGAASSRGSVHTTAFVPPRVQTLVASSPTLKPTTGASTPWSRPLAPG